MTFLHPWMLAGLAAAGIPFLLHLLARRDPPTVVFPAVRYLVEATAEQQQRRKLQHWLLLLLRTLLILALVLAAAGPSMALRGVPGHAPSALVLVVDNSASSGAVAGGTPRLAQFAAAARAVLARATADDALWLLTADGVPRKGDAGALAALVGRLAPDPRRLDLGAALATAGELLATERRPGEIVLVTDLQASAVSAADVRVPLTVARPAGAPVANVGIAAVDVGAQPWSTDGGRVGVTLAGDSGRGVEVRVRLDERAPRQALAGVGAPATVLVPAAASGWRVVTAELEADEFRGDDVRRVGVRLAPVAQATCDASGRFARAACDVLRQNARLGLGTEVTLGALARGASVVEPPADPAAVGAVNRALAARGVTWRFGAPVLAAAATDSGALVPAVRVQRRLALAPAGSGRTGVLATAGGAPWIVRSGDVVLLGSRLEPEWTDLPVSAAFMPFVDALLNRVARGGVALASAAPGDPVPLPDLVTDVVQAEHRWHVEGGAPFRAPAPGVYALLAGRDTVGALSVNVDPRESQLAPADDGLVTRLWAGARVVPLERAGREAFAQQTRGDLRGPLLWLALLVGLAEALVASGWRRRAA